MEMPNQPNRALPGHWAPADQMVQARYRRKAIGSSASDTPATGKRAGKPFSRLNRLDRKNPQAQEGNGRSAGQASPFYGLPLRRARGGLRISVRMKTSRSLDGEASSF